MAIGQGLGAMLGGGGGMGRGLMNSMASSARGLFANDPMLMPRILGAVRQNRAGMAIPGINAPMTSNVSTALAQSPLHPIMYAGPNAMQQQLTGLQDQANVLRERYRANTPLARMTNVVQSAFPPGYMLGRLLGGGSGKPYKPQTPTGDGELGTPVEPVGTKPGEGAAMEKSSADAGTGPLPPSGPAITGTAPSGPGSVGSGYNAYTGQYGYSRNYTWDEGRRLAGEGPMPSTFAPKRQGILGGLLGGLLENFGFGGGILGNLLGGGGSVKLPTKDLGYIQDYYLGPRRPTFAAAHGLS